jgi:hypothetical protein
MTGKRHCILAGIILSGAISLASNAEVLFSDGFESGELGRSPRKPWAVLESGSGAVAAVQENNLFGSSKVLLINDTSETESVCVGVISKDNVFSGSLLRFGFKFRETSSGKLLDGPLYFHVGRFAFSGSIQKGAALTVILDDGVLTAGELSTEIGAGLKDLVVVVNTTGEPAVQYDGTESNLAAGTADIYINEKKILERVPLAAGFSGEINSFAFQTDSRQTQQVRIDDITVSTVQTK